MYMQMPYGITKGFCAVIAFHYILFVFYYDHQEIWCLDMVSNVWYENERIFDLHFFMRYNTEY